MNNIVWGDVEIPLDPRVTVFTGTDIASLTSVVSGIKSMLFPPEAEHARDVRLIWGRENRLAGFFEVARSDKLQHIVRYDDGGRTSAVIDSGLFFNYLIDEERVYTQKPYGDLSREELWMHTTELALKELGACKSAFVFMENIEEVVPVEKLGVVLNIFVRYYPTVQFAVYTQSDAVTHSAPVRCVRYINKKQGA